MRETRIAVRWTDFDLLGHLTHAIYPVYLDEARDVVVTDAVGDFEAWPWVIAHTSIDYRREIRHPAREVVVRTRVAEVGRTSVTFEQEVLAPDGEVAASARSVLVAWDAHARAARPIGEADRARLLGEAER